MIEPNSTLLLASLMVLVGILAKLLSDRLGFPLLLLFLVVGMLTGEDGIVGIQFDNFDLAFLASNLALAIILLDGGLRTQLKTFKTGLFPAGVLATLGVVLTAGLVGIFTSQILNVDWRLGMLLGSIIGSTDAAAVFNLIRQSGIQLNDRVRSTLEIESGANDPMAIFLVLFFLEVLTNESATVDFSTAAIMFFKQFGLGVVFGLTGGFVLSRLINSMRLPEGLYALLVASGGVVLFALVNLIDGSGFLAIYLTGIWVGNYKTKASEQVKVSMDGFAWLAQAGLFLILGLLVTPSHLIQYLLISLVIAGFLIFVARPAAIFICLLPFRFPLKEIAYVSWVGLRGAVPIVLAIFPSIYGLPESKLLFDVAFVVVLVSLVTQGSTVSIMARYLMVIIPNKSPSIDSRDIWISKTEKVELLAYVVGENSEASGSQPSHSSKLVKTGLQLIQVIRSGRSIPINEELYFQVGDIVWLIVPPNCNEEIEQYFSQRELSGQLSRSNFFGEFVINGDSPANELAEAYGLKLSEKQINLSIAELIVTQKGQRFVVGDSVTLGPVKLTVMRIDRGKITHIGLKV